MSWLAVMAIGAGAGLLGGMFGKGGSAIATPLLHAAGVPAAVAVAAPLPAAVPSTLAASAPYWRRRLVDASVVRWTLAFGTPATVAGALATRWVSAGSLIAVTDVMLVAIGIRLLWGPAAGANEAGDSATASRLRLAVIAVAVGLISGLLANAGGFLLVPLYLGVMRLPIKRALACSLAVSAVLALPGTVVHAALGHIDWQVVAVYGAASIPLSMVGARIAIALDARRLERLYGATLAGLGAVMLAVA